MYLILQGSDTQGQLKSEWNIDCCHSKGLPLARVILGQLPEDCFHCSASLLTGKRNFLFRYLLLLEYPFFLYLSPHQKNSLVKKKNGVRGRPSALCPWPPHSCHSGEAYMLPMALIIASAILCRTWSLKLALWYKPLPTISTWRIVFAPEWHIGQVTCHLLLSPSHWKMSWSCLWAWFSLEKCGICPAWLHSYWGGSHAWI